MDDLSSIDSDLLWSTYKYQVWRLYLYPLQLQEKRREK